MQITSFDEALGRLEGLDAWLTALGIVPKNDRWHKAKEVVRQAKEQRKAFESGGARAFIANYVPALFDAMEITEILRAFSGET